MDPRIGEVMGFKKMKKFCPIFRGTSLMASLIWSLVFLGIPAYASDPPADEPSSVAVRVYFAAPILHGNVRSNGCTTSSPWPSAHPRHIHSSVQPLPDL